MHQIGVVGLSYRHAGVDDIARFSLPKEKVGARLPSLRDCLGAAEVLYVGTCNRVEVLYTTLDGSPAGDGRRDLFRALIGREPQPGEANRMLRAWTGEAALEHLFLVACGLDSAQAGEQEIAAQIRGAWETSRSANVSGPTLDRLVAEALGMATRVHRLEAGVPAPSLAGLAADRVLAHMGVSGAGAAGAASDAGAPPGGGAGVPIPGMGVGVPIPGMGAARPAIPPARGPARRLANDKALRNGPPPRRPPAGGSQPHAGAGGGIRAGGGGAGVLARAIQSRPDRRRRCDSGSRWRRGDSRCAGARPTCCELRGPASPSAGGFRRPPERRSWAASTAGLSRVGMSDLIQTAQERRLSELMRLAPVRAAIDERLAFLRDDLAARAIGRKLADLRGAFEQIAADETDRALTAEFRGLDDLQREQLRRFASTVARRLAHLPIAGMRAVAAHVGADAVDAFFREARLRRNGGGAERTEAIDAAQTTKEILEMQSPSSHPRSAELYERACRVIPGGVNSPVRAFRAVGGTSAVHRARVRTVSGRRRWSRVPRPRRLLGPVDPGACAPCGVGG